MSGETVLETARLILRPLAVRDAEALHPGYADVDAMRWWSHAPHETFEQTCEKLERDIADTAWRGWAITLRGDDPMQGRAIGTVAAHEKRQGRVFEIGYSLLRAHWRGGIASEAVSRLLDLLFREEGARRVFADTDPDNVPSNTLLTRLGFVKEGQLRAEWDTHIGVRDSYIWGLLADEWSAR